MIYYQLTLVGDSYLTPLKILECLKITSLEVNVLTVVKHWKGKNSEDINYIRPHYHVVLESCDYLDFPKYNTELKIDGVFLETARPILFNEIGKFYRYLINDHCDFIVVKEIDTLYTALEYKQSPNEMIADWLYYRKKVKRDYFHYFMLKRHGINYLKYINQLKEVEKVD